MSTPCLCKKHCSQVGNYFDTQVALAFDLDADGCVICNRTIFLEEARRFIEQFRLAAEAAQAEA